MVYMKRKLAHWSGVGGGLPDIVLDLYNIPSAVHPVFHSLHLFIRFMNESLHVRECGIGVIYLFCC